MYILIHIIFLSISGCYVVVSNSNTLNGVPSLMHVSSPISIHPSRQEDSSLKWWIKIFDIVVPSQEYNWKVLAIFQWNLKFFVSAIATAIHMLFFKFFIFSLDPRPLKNCIVLSMQCHIHKNQYKNQLWAKFLRIGRESKKIDRFFSKIQINIKKVYICVYNLNEKYYWQLHIVSLTNNVKMFNAVHLISLLSYLHIVEEVCSEQKTVTVNRNNQK